MANTDLWRILHVSFKYIPKQVWNRNLLCQKIFLKFLLWFSSKKTILDKQCFYLGFMANKWKLAFGNKLIQKFWICIFQSSYSIHYQFITFSCHFLSFMLFQKLNMASGDIVNWESNIKTPYIFLLILSFKQCLINKINLTFQSSGGKMTKLSFWNHPFGMKFAK